MIHQYEGSSQNMILLFILKLVKGNDCSIGPEDNCQTIWILLVVCFEMLQF